MPNVLISKLFLSFFCSKLLWLCYGFLCTTLSCNNSGGVLDPCLWPPRFDLIVIISLSYAR